MSTEVDARPERSRRTLVAILIALLLMEFGLYTEGLYQSLLVQPLFFLIDISK
jgi:uncharacterized membrane protein